MNDTYEMAKLTDQCIKVSSIDKKLTIFSKFLNIYGVIAITITGEIIILPKPDIEDDAFLAFKTKIANDIDAHIKQSINNN